MNPLTTPYKGHTIRLIQGAFFVFADPDKTAPNDAIFRCARIGDAKAKITKLEMKGKLKCLNV